jgi:hypothetical protein
MPQQLLLQTTMKTRKKKRLRRALESFRTDTRVTLKQTPTSKAFYSTMATKTFFLLRRRVAMRAPRRKIVTYGYTASGIA